MNDFKFDKKVLSEIVEKGENGISRNDISGWLIEKLDVLSDPSKFNQIEKYIRKSGFKFKKVAGNWDHIIEYFDINSEPSKEGLTESLKEFGMTEVQSKKYVSSYWYVLNEIYKLDSNS